MSRRARWLTAAFLTITAAAIGWELLAAADGNPDTWTWTQLIVRYIPAPITMAVIAVLVAWVPSHFAYYYRRRAQRAQAALRTAADRAEAALLLHGAAGSHIGTQRLITHVRRAIDQTQEGTQP